MSNRWIVIGLVTASLGCGLAACDDSPASPPAKAGSAAPPVASEGAAAVPDADLGAGGAASTPSAAPSAAAPPPNTPPPHAAPGPEPAGSGLAVVTPAPSATTGPSPSPEPAPPPPPAPASPPVPAPEPGSADAIAVRVDAIYLDHKSFRAKFKQAHTQKVAGVTKESTGTLFVERPNKISFRYDPPNQNRIVSDGTTLKVYVASDQQMLVRSVDQSEYPGALAFLLGKGMHPSFTFELNEKAKFDGGPVLLGTPRKPTPHYEHILFYIDDALLAKESANTVRRVLILDAQGNRNRFDFTEAAHPPSIPASEFTFEPPPGTNIVKQ